MSVRPRKPRESVIVVAVSGGPDSVYLFHKTVDSGKGPRLVVGHVNYGTRGTDSGKDQELVERLGRSSGIETKILKPDKRGTPGRCRGTGGNFPSGFEAEARDVRNDFLKKLAAECGAGNIVFAHTADEQVETILMRFFEGAGIAGLKGIPRETEDGIVRPILHIWKEDILKYLKENKIPYRVDRSNFDTRFERNWIRHVLIPLLEKRYGKVVKKRIFTLGERFRELDDYLETEARKWIRRNMENGKRSGRGERNVDKFPTWISTPAQRKRVDRGEAMLPPEDGASTGQEGTPCFARGSFSLLPTAVRVKILQRICFDRLGLAPNERLLVSMDRVVREGGPNARVRAGRGWELVNRYERSAFVPAGDVRRGAKPSGSAAVARTAIVLEVEEKGSVTPAQARRAAASGRKEYFDAARIHLPLTVRTLRAGDRIRPFGLDSEKKVKEILIDRKVPRDDRWGRPVVCDADGKILWIPGVVRSAHAPVTPATRKTVRVRIRREPVPRSRK